MISKKLGEFVKEIKEKNRNPVDTSVLEELNSTETNPFVNVPPGQVFYRCRVVKDNRNTIGVDPGFVGYNAVESFVPPKNKTKDMRANYRFIPYLYVASTKDLAVVETRPRIVDTVSIATITVQEDMLLFDLRQVKDKSEKRNVKDNLLIDLSVLYSKPVETTDNTDDYLPTQFIAEYIKKLGYDGIIYPSSHGAKKETDYNLVVFNYDKCYASGSELKALKWGGLSDDDFKM